MSQERPTAFASYAYGTIVVPIAAFWLMLSTFENPEAGPQDVIINALLILLAPTGLFVFGMLSAIPRRRRYRALTKEHGADFIVDAIVTPASRAAFGLEGELDRSYTITLKLAHGNVSVWKRGLVRPYPCTPVVSAYSSVHASVMKLHGTTIAALAMCTTDGSVLPIPLVSPRSVVNIPAGTRFVESVVFRLHD